MASLSHYDQHAARLTAQYETLSFEAVHEGLLNFLPPAGATVLDVGAGSGRDAAWLADRGYEVVAVEPSPAMLAQARALHAARRIHWVADALIEHALPQMPASRLGTGPGFVTHSFLELRPVTAVELRVGSTFSGQTAKHLHRSLSEISELIRNMPANYLRWPSSDEPIFKVARRRMVATPDPLQIDAAFLWSLGEFRIPIELWQAMSHYNVWIEPVLVAEWARLLASYDGGARPEIGALASSLLTWVDPARDTSFARAAVERVRAAGKPVYCVWSGARLPDQYDVDHCFPFSA